MSRAVRAAVLSGCTVLSACSAATHGRPIPGATATPPPTAGARRVPSVFVLRAVDGGTSQARFVRRDGSEIRSVPLPEDVRFDAGHLVSVGADGVTHDHGALDGMAGDTAH